MLECVPYAERKWKSVRTALAENSSCGFTIWKETKRFSDILKIDAEKAKQLLDGKGVPFELTNKKNEKYTTNLLLTVSVYNGKHYPKFDLPVKPPKKY